MMAAAEELGQSIGVATACQVLNIPRSSLYRGRHAGRKAAPPGNQRPRPPRALSDAEREEVRSVLNSELCSILR